MSSLKTKKKNRRSRMQRGTSNVFSIFSQSEIQRYKEAFNFIDQNHDGFIDKEDLLELMISLGKEPQDQELEEMISEAPGPINFTMFLTLFGERFTGTDPKEVIANAFKTLDDTDTGLLPVEVFRELMSTMGERWTLERIDDLLLRTPVSNGLINIAYFVDVLKHGHAEQPEMATNGDATPAQVELGEITRL